MKRDITLLALVYATAVIIPTDRLRAQVSAVASVSAGTQTDALTGSKQNVGQPIVGQAANASVIMHGGLLPTFTPGMVPTSVSISSANPPLDNPFVGGMQPFRDVLQTGTSLTVVTQGIGAAGTPCQNTVCYAPISVTFSTTPAPAPSPGNISVACNGTGPYPCPSVSSVAGSGSGPYSISLSSAIPPRNCTTLTFAGTVAGQKLQYQYLTGDLNYSGLVATADVATLVNALANGSAALPSNLARYDINRSGIAAAADLLRLVQLLNGVNTSQPWLGATVAACP